MGENPQNELGINPKNPDNLDNKNLDNKDNTTVETDNKRVKNKEEFTEEIKTDGNMASVLSPENRSFFGKMSEEGEKIANQVYEGLYKIPGVNRVVGKMEIAYNQFWIDRHQEKAVQSKERMDGLDLRIGAFDQSKKEIESVIENLKQQNILGVESLQIKLQDIDRQKADFLNEKDRVQSKFEARDNKMRLYMNERDRVADKLIERYEEKLKPMEAKLESLQTFRDQIDLMVAVTEAKHKESLVKLDGIEKEKNKVEDALRRTGMSEKEIRKFEAIKQLEGVLAGGREKVRAEKENLARRKTEINKRIAKVDARANLYRDKREEFVRVKERKPIKVDVATRQKGEVFTGEEEVRAHRRDEASYPREPVSAEIKKESKDKKESVKDRERLSTTAYINGWNTFLKKIYKGDAKFIDAENFMTTTGLSKDYRLDFKDFKNILGKYLKYRKLPMEQFNKSIDAFFEKKVKVEK